VTSARRRHERAHSPRPPTLNDRDAAGLRGRDHPAGGGRDLLATMIVLGRRWAWYSRRALTVERCVHICSLGRESGVRV
jgi:hypothetical protein